MISTACSNKQSLLPAHTKALAKSLFENSNAFMMQNTQNNFMAHQST